MKPNRLVTSLAASVITTLLSACATTGPAVAKQSTTQVTYQASTHLWDQGPTVDGKLCFDDHSHWDVSTLPHDGGALDLRGRSQELVVRLLNPSEHDVADRAGTMDLRFGPDHLDGRIGWEQFSLRTVGDRLEGTYRLNAMNPVPLTIYGMDQLWKLPLADQGIVLPNLLRCADKSATHGFAIDLRDLKSWV